jgi:hypothetical protein
MRTPQWNLLRDGWVIWLMTIASMATAQHDILEQLVDIEKQTTTVASALDLLSKKTGCVFSYAGGVIDLQKKVAIGAKKKSVRDVLFQMFGPAIECTQRKNFIVLTKAKTNGKIQSGYIQNQKGDPIANATIYDPVKLRSARTNKNGYFEIKLRTDSIPPLVVKKDAYRDTLLLVSSLENQLSYVILQEKDSSMKSDLRQLSDSVRMNLLQFGEWTKNRIAALTEVQNVHDSLFRTGQVSFVPGLGTNGRMSGVVENNWSFNVLGGLNGGVRLAEIGGVFNINRGNVRYFQVGGIFNLVEGTFKGVQMGGVANWVDQEVFGFQAAGFINLNQKKVQGLHAAGFMNVNRGGFDGLSAAGFYNHANDTSRGLQLSGAINRVGCLKGVQISGFYNRAIKVNGVQLGIINRADTVSGASVGFLSFVRSGYREVAAYYDDLQYAGAQWRTGTRWFYNILDAAVRIEPLKRKTHFAYGYGIGVSSNDKRPWIWNNDVTVHQYLPGRWTPAFEGVARYQTAVERRFGRVLILSLGATANFWFAQKFSHALVFPFPTKDFLWYEVSSNGTGRAAWIGWRVGIRFCLNPKTSR